MYNNKRDYLQHKTIAAKIPQYTKQTDISVDTHKI